MLMQFDPFRELDRLTQQVTGSLRPPVAPMDAYRQGDTLVARFDLPGVDPGSIELTVEKNVLTLNAERAVTHEDGQEWLVSERPHGRISRQLFLGESLDVGGIEATYDAGVLTVTVPVTEQARPRKVEITSAGSGAKAIQAESQAA